MKDEHIDFSDIPELDEDFWKRAQLIEPDRTEQVTLRVKHSVLAYFKASGKGYQTRINQVLESYVRERRATFRADAERHTAEAERIEREVATTRERRWLVRRRVRIAVRIAAGCGAVLLVLAFAARWHTDLRGVLADPLLYGVVPLALVAGPFLVWFGAQDGNRRVMLGGGLLAAGALALFLGVSCAGGGANRPGLRVGDHARGFPPAGKHGFRGGSAARRQLGCEADAPGVAGDPTVNARCPGRRGEAARLGGACLVSPSRSR